MPTDEPKTPHKRPSGGARAVAAKHAQREAERKRGGWRDRWLGDLEALGKPPEKAEAAHTWLARAAVLIVHATMHDTAVPAEQMRRDAMRQIEQASKVLDPAKLSEQLEELERAREELINARTVEAREDRPAPAGMALS